MNKLVGYLAMIFSKINKVGLFLQGKQLIVFITNDKILDNFTSDTVSLIASQYLNTFLMR